MANTTRREVELRINANDLSSKSLDQLLDSFTKLREAQDAFAKSGDASQRSIRELKQDLSDLQAIAVELKSRAALVDQFLAMQEQASKAAARVDAAKVALDKFNAARKEDAALSKKQQGELNRLTREVDKSEKALAGATARTARFGEELAALGTGDTSATRDALVKFSTQLGTSLEGAEQAIRRYDATLRANAATEKAAADKKRELARVTKEAQAELSKAVAFNAQGRDALKATDVAELSKDYDALAKSSRKAGDALRAIVDPGRQALTSLEGLEQAIVGVNERLAQAASNRTTREEVRRLRAEYSALAADAGKAAASLGDDIGQYRQAEQALGTLRAQVTTAQQGMRQLAGQMAVTAQPSEKLATELQKAQARLRDLVATFDRQAQALANLRQRLRDAGVETEHLGEAERRLESVARGVADAQGRLGVAMVDLDGKARKSANALSLFDDKGRKALSSSQRLRGEILSLAQSYVGLFAAVQAGQGAVAAAVSREQILRQLELTEGSVEKARAKFEQLKKTAETLGLPLQMVAGGFAKIALGADAAGVKGQRLDAFYVNLNKTIRGLALDGEKAQRVFTAVGQVFDKNQLMSEELKGQLAESLPGIVAIAAEALRMTSDELKAALEAGTLGVQDLIVIFDEYARRVDKLSPNSNSAVTALANFKTAVYELQLALADSGFLEAFTDLLKEFTQAAKEGRLQGAIEGLGKALRFAAEAAVFLLENIELTLAVFTVLIGLNVAKVMFGMAASLKTLGLAFGTAAGGATLLRVALYALPLVALVAGLALWASKSETVRAAMSALWTTVKEVVDVIGDFLTLPFEGFLDRTARRLGRVKDAFDEVGAAAERARSGKASRSTVDGHGSTGTWDDEAPTGSWDDDSFDRLENQRIAARERTRKEAEKIQKDILKIQQDADKAHAKSVGDIEAEVRAEYKETQDKIDALRKRDGARADEAQKALEAQIQRIVAVRKATEGAKFKRDDRSALQEAMERENAWAQRIKDLNRFAAESLDQDYERGLVALRDYYAKRRDLTISSINAEIVAAKAQIELERNSKDPQAGKRIVALEARIVQLTQQEAAARRDATFEIERGEKALREHFDAMQDELAAMHGDELQNNLRDIQRFYEQQLKQVNLLTGAAHDRAKAILDETVQLKTQLAVIKEMQAASAARDDLVRASIDAAKRKGELTEREGLLADSEANKLLLQDLEALKQKLIDSGDAGTNAFKRVVAQIVHLQAQTDLLGDRVHAVFNEAVGAGLEAFRSKDPGLDRLRSAQEALIQFNRQQELGVALTERQRAEYQRLQQEVQAAQGELKSSTERALKAFGKSVAKSLADSFMDELSKTITKALQESFVGQFVKGLFGNLFSGIGGMFKTGHTGTVVGGAAPMKRVSPFAFVGAPRYHSGGLPGLRRDEVPMIAKIGEEVLSRTDSRNVLNGGTRQAVASNPGRLVVQLDPHAMQMTMREWLEREMATIGSTQ